MQIQNLKLLNFRNYHSLELSFSNNLNIFYGNNGAGKTNIVEAIYFLALTRSFINNEDKTVISYNEDVCRIEADVDQNKRNTYKIILKTNGGKVAKINNKIVSKLSNYISKIKLVLFHSDDLRLIKDSPSVRRKLLNIEISQISINYLKNLAIYNKLLKQRNAYLKMMYVNANESPEYLKTLNEKIVDVGLKVYNERKKQLAIINEKITKYFYKFTNIEGLSLIYSSDYNNLDKKQILLKMEKSLSKDLFVKKTTFGVHHDDIEFNLVGHNLKLFGSEGQQKNAVIAYKFAIIESIIEQTNEYPIFILDDLFGELDKEKIQNITNNLNSKVQTFITTTDIDFINQENLIETKIFNIKDGKIEEKWYAR